MGPNAQLDVNLRRLSLIPTHISWPECLKKLLEGSLGLHMESQTWLEEEESIILYGEQRSFALKEESGQYTSSLLLGEEKPSGGTQRDQKTLCRPPSCQSFLTTHLLPESLKRALGSRVLPHRSSHDPQHSLPSP